MKVRINPGKTGVITIKGHVDPNTEYDGEDAEMLVEMGRAVEINAAPAPAPEPEDEPDDIEFDTPSGRKLTTRAKKAKKKRSRK